MNNFRGSPVNPQYPNFSPPGPFSQFVPVSNKQFVQSLEEALNIPVQYNSQMVYFDMNKDLAYDIATNSKGDKSWAIIELKLKETSMTAQQNLQKTNEELIKRIEELEKKLEVTNGKHNDEQAIPRNE